MKKFLFLLLLIPSFIKADEFRIADLSGGVYSNASANKIPDNSANFIQNFLTDIEPIAVERNGYVKRDSTVLGGTKPVYGLWEFVDNSGNNWIISYSSRTYYKNTIGATPTTFGPITTVDQIPDCAKNLGKIWCVNGTDPGWSFDGSSTATVSGMPLGALIEPWRTRLVISQITGAKSTVRVSADGDGTSWTIGPLATDPFSFQIGGANDGEYVRCLVGAYLDTMIIGRRYDLWGIDGFDQSDFTVRNISDQVGCIEPRTPKEVDGELVFLSARGLEAMNGRNIRNISDPIRDITDILVKNTVSQRSDIETTQSDFGQGSSDSVYIDTHTSPGDVQFTFPDTFDILRDGSNGSKNVWTKLETGSTTGNMTATSGSLGLQNSGNTLGRLVARTTERLADFRQGTTYYISDFHLTSNSSNLDRLYVVLSSATSSVTNPDSLVNNFTFLIVSSYTKGVNVPWYYVSSISNTTDGTIYVGYSTGTSFGKDPATGLPVDLQLFFYLSTTTYRLTLNDTVLVSGTHTWPGNQVYFNLAYLKGSSGSGTATFEGFAVAPQTGTYTSRLIPTSSNITAWLASSISNSFSSATVTYQFGSTSTANVASITNYASITNGAVPSVSTNPYAAFKAYFNTNVTTGSAKLNEFVTTWNEGSQAPSPVATVYDRRYWLSFTTTTTGSPLLDEVLVWQRNKSFTFFRGINAGSFAIWRDALYFGNSNNTGYVYKYDIGNNDDSSNINSFIRTKSYDFQTFSRAKEFSKVYIGFLGGSGSLNISYQLNRYGTNYDLGSDALNEHDAVGQIVGNFWFPLNQQVRGREIQFTLTKNDTGSRLRLYDFLVQYELKESILQTE